jgi:hypothetical protein
MEVAKDFTQTEIDRSARHRRLAEPEILHEAKEIKKEEIFEKNASSDEEIDQEEIIRRRLEIKKKALQRQEVL